VESSINERLASGFKLMLVGMTIVYPFLALLVGRRHVRRVHPLP
jgi:Na+-transporting methylmalonyl-CoA/oxaloacetate decarboxylase gamma subunit